GDPHDQLLPSPPLLRLRVPPARIRCGLRRGEVWSKSRRECRLRPVFPQGLVLRVQLSEPRHRVRARREVPRHPGRLPWPLQELHDQVSDPRNPGCAVRLRRLWRVGPVDSFQRRQWRFHQRWWHPRRRRESPVGLQIGWPQLPQRHIVADLRELQEHRRRWPDVDQQQAVPHRGPPLPEREADSSQHRGVGEQPQHRRHPRSDVHRRRHPPGQHQDRRRLHLHRPRHAHLWIERVFCGPGHGISIGSLGKAQGLQEESVRNVTVKTVTFSGTQNGVRIKTWGTRIRGQVRGVVFEDALMRNVQNPIIIDQNYCPGNKGCPGQSSGIKISQVKYNNIRGTSATPVAVNFDCSPSNPCSGITLQDIKLSYHSQRAQSSCKYANGVASGLNVPPSCL
ncbi:unnamed protein product, partial [Musa textilis]